MTIPDLALDRRTVLAGMAGTGALSLGGCATLPAAQAHPATGPSLDSLARRSGRRFGSAVAWNAQGFGGSIQNPAYTAIVAAECGVVVPENELKWTSAHPAPGTYDFSRMDDIVRWAQSNGIAVRGHTLLWHRTRWFPEWLNNYEYGANPVQEAERMLTEHIRTVTDRYRGTITSYDVVNETVMPDGSGLEETSMSRAMGGVLPVVDLAFHVARDQLPDGQLVYNDYMSWEPNRSAHFREVLKLLEGFRKRRVPVDALGIQAHIEMYSLDPATGVGPYLEREWRQFLDEVVAMGY
jgi:endo-1,4-beta-xylanase